jgi:hypothetical protein
VLFLLVALVANTFHQYLCGGHAEPTGQIQPRRMDVRKAIHFLAIGTGKVYMIIGMGLALATVVAYRKSCYAIGPGNLVQQTALAKVFQHTVQSYSVYFSQ